PLTSTIIVTTSVPSGALAATLAVTLPAGATFDSATTSRFLSQLYPDLLGRPIDDQALAGYTKGLAAGTTGRQQIAESILASPEYRSNLVRSLYARFLRRPLGAADTALANSLIFGGLSERDLIVSIVGSPKYFQAIAKVATFTVANGIVTADLGALPPGGVTVTIVVIPRVAGAQVASARVGGADVDLNPLDNTAKVSVFAGAKATA